MRLVWLCFLLLGASALNTRRHHGEYLAPASFLQQRDPSVESPAPPTVPAVTCNYVVDDDARFTSCPQRCVPADHTPTYERWHYAMNSQDCPTYQTIEPCPEITRCPPEDWPAECQATFSEWSACSLSCGGGRQERRRTLPLNCLSCHHCDVEYRSCNTQACGRDCVLLDWQDWSVCSLDCIPTNPLPATQTRSRQIVQGIAPGRICEPNEYFETRTCEPAPPQCSVDCRVSDWGQWSDCSASCGCGVQTRTRTVLEQPQGYGAPCPHLTQSQSCHCSDCPQTCEYSEWTFSPCSGDCYVNYTIEGENVIEYPERRKVRYILREAKGGMPSCNEPCELAKTEQCRNVPPCPEDCKLTSWGPWVGECPVCLTPGQPVPVQIRERSIISLGNGICGCTRQERVCDIPWCCEDCLVSNFTEWGPCIPNGPCVAGTQTGSRTRQRDILRPANRCGARCPNLEETQECSVCCAVDCEVGSWTGWLPSSNQCGKLVGGVPTPITCGSERGIIKYTRQITRQPNSCGAPCPDLEKTVDCYPPTPCCPVNCTMGPDEVSDCYGCGANARRWRKKTVVNYESCGGVPCCYYGGCSLFTPEPCPTPTPCPQTPCTYSEWGNYSACSASCAAGGTGGVPQQCRQRHLIHQPDGETCPGQLIDCIACNTHCCPVNCEVGAFGDWTQFQPSCGLQVRSRSRPITVPPSCGGTPCPPVVQHDTTTACCPVDCVVDDWGSWSLCPSCVPDGETVKKQKRSRAILIQNTCGGHNCPTDLVQERDCPNVPCDRNCEVSAWSNWGDCNAGCGDGFQTRTRTVTVDAIGYGMACPPLVETKHCYIPCPTCVLGELEYGECTPTCSNVPGKTGIRRVSRNSKPLTLEDGTQLEMCNVPITFENCSIPCCPVDCQMTVWGAWSTCVDGVKSRTRTVAQHPSCGGAACPVCLLERDVCVSPPIPGECEFGEACEEGISAP